MEVELTIRRPRRTRKDVRGSSFDALARAMDRNGCWDKYSFAVTYRTEGPPDDVTTVKMNVTPAIEMPRWRGYRRADDAHKREWDRMYAALERHEDEHHRLFTRKAEQFRDSVPNISIAMDRQAVARTMEDFRREAQQVMDDFDARTDHGRRQGVELNEPGPSR